MDVIFNRRDFSGAVLMPAVELGVDLLEWRAVGGAWKAQVTATGASQERLWGLVDLLRCEMVVSDERAACWWGYVSAVEVHAGARVIRVSLAEMWNTVRVSYRDDSPSQEGGKENFTAWTADAESVRAWGSKEKNFRMGVANAADAAAYAASLLAEAGKPAVSAWVSSQAAEFPYVVIEGRGWWEALDWEYYSQGKGQTGNLASSGSIIFGTSGSQSIAQGFSYAGGGWYLNEVWIKIKRLLATDNLSLTVCANNAGVPGTVLGTATAVPYTALEEEMTWVKFSFSTAVAVTNGTQWLKISRSGSMSAVNYYIASVDEGLNYANGYLIYYTGSAWTSRVPDADLTFLVVGVDDTGTQVKAMVVDGQFFTVCRLEGESGIDGRLYRDGEKRIREEAELLLKLGQSTGGENLAFVNRDRVVRVYAKPGSSPVRFQVGEDGSLTLADGRPALASDQPAGQWAKLGDLSAVGELMGYDSAVWIEGAVWEKGRLMLSK